MSYYREHGAYILLQTKISKASMLGDIPKEYQNGSLIQTNTWPSIYQRMQL